MAAALIGEKLCRDIHPAEILMPDGTLVRGVRLFVTSHRLIAYGTDGHGQIDLRLDAQLEQPSSIPANRGTLGAGRLEARLADGSTAWVNAGGGCGCGSPLKALAAPVGWSG